MTLHSDKLLQFFKGLSGSPKVPALGERELEVMKVFWQNHNLSAKQVLQCIADKELSLSTMQSTLERLHRKKLLQRTKSGRYFVYQAAISRVEFISQLMGDIAEQFCDGDVAPMVSGFSNFYTENKSTSEAPDTEPSNELKTNLSDDESTY